MWLEAPSTDGAADVARVMSDGEDRCSVDFNDVSTVHSESGTETPACTYRIMTVIGTLLVKV